MRTLVRLGLYGLVLVVVFAVAFVTAGAVVPEESVRSWVEGTADEHAAQPAIDTGGQEEQPGASSLGLSLAQDGYRLTGLSVPEGLGTVGELSLTVVGLSGEPVTDFDVEQEKELHLIVVRADGQHFRHVHPKMSADGTWSLPWEWQAAGSYRVFADFVPGDTGTDTTLSTSVQVAGEYAPVMPAEQLTTATVDGFEVSLDGDLTVGESSELNVNVSRDGQQVTSLEPYLGAYGHMVALREGDLAYLHVHPHGEQPRAGETSGPDIVFEASAPTPGRYLLFLDFKVDGQVRTAALVVDAVDGPGAQHGSGANSNDNGEDRTNTRKKEGHDHGE